MSIPILPIYEPNPKPVELWVDLDDFVKLPHAKDLLLEIFLRGRYNRFAGIVNGESVTFKSSIEMMVALEKLLEKER